MSISGFDIMEGNDLLRHFFGGFVRLHILHHAAEETICGVGMIEELQRHGYKLGPGTLYPILHHLEQSNYLVAEAEVVEGKRRKNYRITPKGRKLLTEARAKLRELVHEVVEGQDGQNRDKGSA
jgi:PadR family transcriptional regulator, regulatory protein PadR